jgi:hypothetical protein
MTTTQEPQESLPPTQGWTGPYGNVISAYQSKGESWPAAVDRGLAAGFTGAVCYFTPGTKPSWDARLSGLAAAHGTDPLTVQVTVRTHDDAGLAAILEAKPAAWRLIYDYWQEVDKPRNGVVGNATAIASYRAVYAAAAAVCREHGAELPWPEFTEWSVDRHNAAKPDLAALLPDPDDIAGVLWSLPIYNLKDVVDEQIADVTGWMAAHAPGKPWGCMMTCVTVPAIGATDAQKQLQATLATRYWTRTKAAGAACTGWFNWTYDGTGIDGDSRYETNPYLATALRDFQPTA